MVRLVILSSVLVPLLAACGEKTETEIAGEQAIEAVKRVLTDPYSAQFKVIDYRKLAANLYAICGEVNAKNRMGGYTGYKKFAVTFDGKERTVYLESDDLGRLAANLYCGEKFKHTIVR